MKPHIKKGLWLGTYMAVFLIITKLFEGDVHTGKDIVAIIVPALITGAIMGLLAAWFQKKFSAPKLPPREIEIQTGPDEHIIFQTPASYSKEALINGQLCLTNKQLIFKSHELTFWDIEWKCPLSDITGIKQYRYWGLFKGGLLIQRSESAPQKFHILKITEFLHYLNSTITLTTGKVK
jgi:hypothetical protein